MSAQPVHDHPGRVEKTPAAIRAALLPEETPRFEADYQTAIQTAAETYDLTPVQRCLDHWWPAAQMASDDPDGYRQAMDDARKLTAGEHVVTVSWEETAERLGLRSPA